MTVKKKKDLKDNLIQCFEVDSNIKEGDNRRMLRK